MPNIKYTNEYQHSAWHVAYIAFATFLHILNALCTIIHWVPVSILYGKGLPQQAEVAQGAPGRLRPPIFLTFSTTRMVGHQPYTLAAFTPAEIPGTHF
jgi:hypothetical protein